MSKNIEVEVRSFVDDKQFENIKNILDKSYKFVKELKEVTVYFSGEKDLRMRKNETEAFVILKEGKIHDDSRKEFEIKIGRGDFDNMIEFFRGLGYEIEIEWQRNRLEYKNDDVKILLNYTKGYGKILKIEKMAEEGEELGVHGLLVDEMSEFGIAKITSK
ncbi:MAG: CYTH domain-containing protein [Candidatus Pacebacteria bacterium]|nr:CYTH domain-containing protein [Candidatus Paceibacterota bacterium]